MKSPELIAALRGGFVSTAFGAVMAEAANRLEAIGKLPDDWRDSKQRITPEDQMGYGEAYSECIADTENALNGD